MKLLFSSLSILYLALIWSTQFEFNKTESFLPIYEISETIDIRVNNPNVFYSSITKDRMRNAQVSSMSLNQEEFCLALNIYHEARGSSKSDQIAVASTTLNRVDSSRWKNNICDVVYTPWAFSWTNDKLSDTPKEKEAWESAQTLSVKILQGTIKRNTKANHYFNPSIVTPKWSLGVSYKIIGSHKYLKI